LLEKAEQITRRHGYKKIAVISGVGVRNYYRKQGYELQSTYMIKDLIHNKNGGTYYWIECYIELIICVWYLILLILMIIFRKYIPNTQYL
jgi:hypothetical protein